MSKAPRFSLITIVRNNSDGLEVTRTSVRSQNFVDFEWLVIDGASTDGTAERALSLAVEGANVLSEPDRGIYDAMNKGLARATGDYVVMLNAGDSFAANDVLSQVDRELTARDNPDVLYGGSIMQFPGRRFARPVKDPAYIWHGQPGLHQATLFKRSVHQKYPYDDSFRIVGDYDVITRLWAAGYRFESCPVTISVNTFDSQSTSGRNKTKLITEAIRCQRKNLKLGPVKLGISVARRIGVSVMTKLLANANGGKA